MIFCIHWNPPTFGGQLKELVLKGGFKLVKWLSKDAEVAKKLNELDSGATEAPQTTVALLTSQHAPHVLGLNRDVASDTRQAGQGRVHPLRSAQLAQTAAGQRQAGRQQSTNQPGSPLRPLASQCHAPHSVVNFSSTNCLCAY